MRISIIIPAYNEEKRIPKTLEEYYKFFKNLKKEKKLDFEILVVINCSTDKTEQVVKAYCKRDKEIRCMCLKEKGKGLAVIEGFKDALKRENDLIGFVDADMSTSPEAFYDLIKNIGDYQGIIASRYVNGAIVYPKPSLSRSIASRMFNFIVRVLFLIKYRDTQCGAKILKKYAVEKIIPYMGITSWAFDVDLLYQAKKLKLPIIEYPTNWKDKENSKLNLKKTSVQMFMAVVQLRVKKSRFRRLLGPFKKPIKLLFYKIKDA
jgi:glycosyltransferase involved in cell wall biosynthesis